jgi:hypothetical protein
MRVVPHWVFKGCHVPSDGLYRAHFGTAQVPDIPSYSTDPRDFVFDPSYSLEKGVLDHLFARAKIRAGLPDAPDEVVQTYLRGAIEGLVPKIRPRRGMSVRQLCVVRRRD